MRFELVLFRRTRLIFPIGLNCTLLFPSSFFSATSFLPPFFVSPFLFSILPLTPSAPLSLFLRLSFSLIVNATGSIKSLDRHLCTPWQLPLPNTLSSLLSSFPLFFYVRLTPPPPSLLLSPFFSLRSFHIYLRYSSLSIHRHHPTVAPRFISSLLLCLTPELHFA